MSYQLTVNDVTLKTEDKDSFVLLTQCVLAIAQVCAPTKRVKVMKNDEKRATSPRHSTLQSLTCQGCGSTFLGQTKGRKFCDDCRRLKLRGEYTQDHHNKKEETNKPAKLAYAVNTNTESAPQS